MKHALIILVWLVPGLALAQAEALENPGTVSAVQERLYPMHHELQLGVGVLPLDAFYKGVFASVGYTYHFTDSFGWQLGRGLLSKSLHTGLRSQLERDFGVLPTVFEEVEWLAGSDLVWSPFYGKVAVGNRKVLHFSAFLSLGGSVVKMSHLTSPRPGAHVGLGGRLFSSRRVSFRLDVADDVVFLGGTRIKQVPSLMLSTAFNFGATE